MNPSEPSSRQRVLVARVVCGIAIVFALVMTARSIPGVYQNFKSGLQRGLQQATAISVNEDLAMKIASEPVKIPASSATKTTVNEKRKAFRARTYVDAYRQNGRHDKPWDAEAIAFLNAWLDQGYGGGASGEVDLAKAGDKLAAEGADDPIILTVCGATTEEWHEARRRLQRAVAAFDKSNYKAYPQVYAHVLLGQHSDRGSDSDEEDAAAFALFQKGLKDGSFPAENSDDLAETLTHGWAEKFYYRKAPDIFAAVYEAGPDYRWLGLSLEGVEEIALAWRARGNGFADTVTSQGWKGFEDHLGKARGLLTEAWNIHPEWPLASEQMMQVCLGESQVEEERVWFDRTIAAQVDYMSAWSDLRWVLRPRWGGSLEAMRAFGITALNTGRFDTDVPYELLSSVNDMEAEMQPGLGAHIYDRTDIWPYLQKMSQGYIDAAIAATNKDTEAHWRGNYAEIAFLAKDYQVARQQFEATAWAEPAWLDSWGTDLSMMREETAARTSGAGAEVAEAEKARQDGRVAEALAQYLKLGKTSNLEDRAMWFVQARIASLQIQQQLADGKTVDFLPVSDDDPNWKAARGSYKRNADGSIDVISGPTGSAIYCHTPVGLNFEVTGEFDVVKTTNNAFQAGLLIGWPDPDSNNFWSFRVKRNQDEGDVAEYFEDWYPGGLKRMATVHPDHNTFAFRLVNLQATASVNGEEIMREEKKPGAIYVRDDQFALGLGAFNDMNETTIRYSNVKLRRLGVK